MPKHTGFQGGTLAYGVSPQPVLVTAITLFIETIYITLQLP